MNASERAPHEVREIPTTWAARCTDWASARSGRPPRHVSRWDRLQAHRAVDVRRFLHTASRGLADLNRVSDHLVARPRPAADLHLVPASREAPGAQGVPLATIHLLVHLDVGQLGTRRVRDDERRRRGAIRGRRPPRIDGLRRRRRQVEPEGRRVRDRLRGRHEIARAVVAPHIRGRDPVRGDLDVALRAVVVRVVAVDDQPAGGRAAPATVGVDLVEVVRPRPVGTRVRAVVRLEPAVRHDVVAVPGNPLPLRDVAGQLGRGVDLPRREARLTGEAAVLDAHREVVRRRAADPALHASIEGAVVGGPHVPAAIRLADQLRDLAAALVHHVVRRDPRCRVHQPAPAPRVGALAGVDDDHRDFGTRGPGVVVRRGAPDGGRVVRPGRQRPGHGQRELRLHLRRHDGRGHLSIGALGEHTAAQRGVDLLVNVLGLRAGIGDATEARHRGRPSPHVRALHLQLVRMRRQQRRARADVGQRIVPDRLGGDTRQGRPALQRCSPQGHHTVGGGHAVELLFTPHHLPTRLGVGDGLEQINRDVEFAGRPLEERIQGPHSASVDRLSRCVREGSGGSLHRLWGIRTLLGSTGGQGQGCGGRRERIAQRVHTNSSGRGGCGFRVPRGSAQHPPCQRGAAPKARGRRPPPLEHGCSICPDFRQNALSASRRICEPYPTMALTSSVNACSSSACSTKGGSTLRSARPPFTA
ncbi:hypothetical protein STIAU_6827 [Stigmatella aurantiaca DW4/3-1]|uniref:Uncharacterized protein n=1 Tax=Stigmatella aurantiaca (strain DW4/3-1) TaxID=378806 RepID=Q08RJ1_STIAD|nr:hypothetical protein STIAU_6827 [Stigmatella aurantiaca DW4/3-1]